MHGISWKTSLTNFLNTTQRLGASRPNEGIQIQTQDVRETKDKASNMCPTRLPVRKKITHDKFFV